MLCIPRLCSTTHSAFVFDAVSPEVVGWKFVSENKGWPKKKHHARTEGSSVGMVERESTVDNVTGTNSCWFHPNWNKRVFQMRNFASFGEPGCPWCVDVTGIVCQWWNTRSCITDWINTFTLESEHFLLTSGLLLFHLRWVIWRSILDLLRHVPGLRKNGLLTVGEAAVIEGWVKLGENLSKSLGKGGTEHNCWTVANSYTVSQCLLTKVIVDQSSYM